MAAYVCSKCGVSFKSRDCNRKYCTTGCYREVQKSQPNAGTFKAGIVPWNTGTKGVMKANIGTFKKGQIPPTKKPIGAVRLREDKNGKLRAWIKVEDRCDSYAWRLRAIVVWEQINGPLPKGMVVHHRDRNELNDALGNLQAMTRAEHLNEHRSEFKRKRGQCEVACAA